MKVSAIIPVHSRRFNAPQIMASLPFDEVIFIDTGEDRIWGRYEAMKRAKHDIIYTQDDDIVNQSLDRLVQSFKENPLAISYAVREDYLPKIEAKTFGKCQLALVGWGSMFDKELLKVFRKYTDVYGVDDLLIREADRAFTVLQGRHHFPVVSDLRSLEGETSDQAMSSEANHVQTMSEMVVKCIELCA